jgi:hypothetical protein
MTPTKKEVVAVAVVVIPALIRYETQQKIAYLHRNVRIK